MKILLYLFALLLVSCSTTSVEYRTATTSLRNDRDYNKAEEYALKALDVDTNDALVHPHLKKIIKKLLLIFLRH